MANKNVGRPSKYTEAVAHEICSRLMDGESLIDICKDEHIPCKQTVYSWLDSEEHKQFLDRYARARQFQAEHEVDEIKAIADNQSIDPGAVQRDRVKIDARKWRASKMWPVKYGDKIQNEQSGTITVLIDKADEGNL